MEIRFCILLSIFLVNVSYDKTGNVKWNEHTEGEVQQTTELFIVFLVVG